MRVRRFKAAAIAAALAVRNEQRRNAAARTLQRFFRYLHARRGLARISANKIYVQFMDGESGRRFWYNTRSGASFWTRPWALWGGKPKKIRYNPAPGQENILSCERCAAGGRRKKGRGRGGAGGGGAAAAATCYCFWCEERYCTPCWKDLHKGGKFYIKKVQVARCVAWSRVNDWCDCLSDVPTSCVH